MKQQDGRKEGRKDTGGQGEKYETLGWLKKWTKGAADSRLGNLISPEANSLHPGTIPAGSWGIWGLLWGNCLQNDHFRSYRAVMATPLRVF